MFVKNYDEIKENLLRFQTKITTILVDTHIIAKMMITNNTYDRIDLL